MGSFHVPTRRVISIFVLAMFNVSIMASLRNLPLVAEYGLSSIFYFILVAVLFLIPTALVSAELATGWPKSGGIYIWVREAFGNRMGFLAIWMQWVHDLAWYPVIMTFIATTLAYVINPLLSNSKLYIFGVILIGFWGMTLLNYLGIKTSSWFSTIGVIAGTLLPGVLIIAFGIAHLLLGGLNHISFTASALLPKLNSIDNIVFLTGLFLAFGGLEVSAAYAGNVKDPQKNYPKSIILSAVIVFFVFMLGSLSIAVVIPQEKISIVAGLLDAFTLFFATYHMEWVMPILAFLLVIGAVAEVNSWIIGPAQGLYATSIHGNLPPLFQKVNQHGTPVNILFCQAVIVTITSFLFLFMPSISSAFWMLTALTAQSYLIMYIIMFLAAIKLRYSKPHVPRAYKVPYQKKGIWFFGSLGIIASVAAIIVAFFPPSQLQNGNAVFHVSFLGIGLIIMLAVPLIIYKMRKPHWYLPEK